jgi:hypothetical protein
MFGIGDIFKSLINPASLLQLAAGPAGWASLAMKTIGSAILNQVISQVGQQLGLPQSVISGAQALFGQTSGTGSLGQQTIKQAVSGLAQQFGLSPREEGQLERSANKSADAIETLVSNMLQQMSVRDKKGEKDAESSKFEGGKGGFLRAIALALGEAADSKMTEMASLANDLKEQTASNAKFTDGFGDKPSQGDLAKANTNSQKLGSISALLQATSQELSILQNVIKTTLDTIGQAQSTVARKG